MRRHECQACFTAHPSRREALNCCGTEARLIFICTKPTAEGFSCDERHESEWDAWRCCRKEVGRVPRRFQQLNQEVMF